MDQRKYAFVAGPTDQPDFRTLLVQQLRNTPWMLVSLLAHGLIGLVLSLFSNEAPMTKPEQRIVVGHDVAELPPLEPPPPDEPPVLSPEVDFVPEPVTAPALADPIDNPDSVTPDEERDDQEASPAQIHPFDADTSSQSVIGCGSGPGPFGNRRAGRGLGRGGGHGSETLHRAKDAGLDWLARHQSEDGAWDADGFMGQCRHASGERCSGRGAAAYDVGTTGLALLAFLGAGNTHREGTFKATVAKGLQWLRNQQDAEGCFGSRTDSHFTYSHAIAALAMAEAYGMTKSGVWRNSAQRGLDFVAHCQNPYQGWRYGVRPGDNDVSVTGWMVMALKSGQLANLQVNAAALQDAKALVESLTDATTGRTGYTVRGERPVRASGREAQFPGEHSESMTAVGMLVRIFAGENPASSAAIRAGAELLQKRLPVWEPESGRVDMYYWYYATLAMFQVGESAWTAWENRLEQAVAKSQLTQGCQAGSWDPVDAWGEDGGRVYSTALMTMNLQVLYRYARVFGTGNMNR